MKKMYLGLGAFIALLLVINFSGFLNNSRKQDELNEIGIALLKEADVDQTYFDEVEGFDFYSVTSTDNVINTNWNKGKEKATIVLEKRDDESQKKLIKEYKKVNPKKYNRYILAGLNYIAVVTSGLCSAFILKN